MNQKEMAKSFLSLAGIGQVQVAYDKFVAPNFIHHNQYFKGDRQSLLTAMEEAHKISSNKSIEVKKIYEDGDTVITHSLVIRNENTKLPIVVVHIFRFENNQIVELWDLGHEVVLDSPNENGVF